MWQDLGLASAVSGDRPDERLRLGAGRDRRLSPDAAGCCRIGTPRRLCVVGRHADGACTPSSRTVAGADARRECDAAAVAQSLVVVWSRDISRRRRLRFGRRRHWQPFDTPGRLPAARQRPRTACHRGPSLGRGSAGDVRSSSGAAARFGLYGFDDERQPRRRYSLGCCPAVRATAGARNTHYATPRSADPGGLDRSAMTGIVVEVGPATIRGPNHADAEWISAGIDGIDDELTLIDECPVTVADVWRTVMHDAAGAVANDVVVLRRAQALRDGLSDRPLTVVEIAPEFVVVSLPGGDIQVVAHGDADRVVTKIPASIAVVVDGPEGVEGVGRLAAEIAHRLRANGVAVTICDRDWVRRSVEALPSGDEARAPVARPST